MELQSSSILQQVLNSYISDDIFLIKTQTKFEDFWSSVNEYGFELTRSVYTRERTLDSVRFKRDCMEWLAEKGEALQLALRAKDIQDDIMVIKVMWVIIHRIDEEKQEALQAGPAANLKIDRSSQHSAS